MSLTPLSIAFSLVSLEADSACETIFMSDLASKPAGLDHKCHKENGA